MIHLQNMDCMEAMAQMPENAFDLAIVDPPYGINEDGEKNHSRGNKAIAKKYKPKNWDKKPASKNYFIELKRVSKYQIIWGANHFIENIPNNNSSCWLVWNKKNGNCHFADCELAYTTFKSAVRIFNYMWNGMLQENMRQKEMRIHPTQKPIALYAWILNKYAKKGWRILDTHLGSGSSAIAAYNAGYEFVGYEIDTDYYNAAKKRLENHKRQLRMFV